MRISGIGGGGGDGVEHTALCVILPIQNFDVIYVDVKLLFNICNVNARFNHSNCPGVSIQFHFNS